MVGVVIPVGPGERELIRLEAVVTELSRHEHPVDVMLFIVDDGVQSREFGQLWPTQTVIRTHIRERGKPDLFSAHVAGTLEALAAVRDAGLEFAVKLDTDAGIINTFSRPLRSVFRDETLGVVGSYDRTASGGTRDWSMWPPLIATADRPFAVRRRNPGVHLVRRSRTDREHVRSLRQAALMVAPAGAHCLGGAYAVSGTFLDTASLAWRPWIGSGLGEDVTVGLLCSAAGLRMQSLTAPGEPFGLAWRGLPATPQELAASGYAIVHSIKAESVEQEQALRDELQRAVASVSEKATG